MHFVVNGVDELFFKSHRPLVSVHANSNSVNIHSVKLYNLFVQTWKGGWDV